MNYEIENDLINNGEEELNEDNMDIENDEDLELDESDDEYYDEMNSEILEAINRNAEYLQLLHKSFNSFKLELCDIKEFWYRRFFKELEIAIDTVEEVEDELFEFPD